MSCGGAHNEVETVSDPMPTASSINSDALLMEKVSGMPARECMSLYLQPMYTDHLQGACVFGKIVGRCFLRVPPFAFTTPRQAGKDAIAACINF